MDAEPRFNPWWLVLLLLAVWGVTVLVVASSSGNLP